MSYIVYLENEDETFSPPEQLLGVAIVGDSVFLSIEQYEETFDTRSFNTLAYVKVSMEELLAALASANSEAEREISIG